MNTEVELEAKAAANNAIANGTITELDYCEGCGVSDVPVELHHFSYLSKHWLNVLFLCRKCRTAEAEHQYKFGYPSIRKLDL